LESRTPTHPGTRATSTQSFCPWDVDVDVLMSATPGTLRAQALPNENLVGLVDGAGRTVAVLRPFEVGRLRCELRDAIYDVAAPNIVWPEVNEYW
jgi:hypothetical protein